MSNAPPLVPTHDAIGIVYLVLDDFGQLGRVYRETDETTDARNVISHMVRGEYHRPVRVIAFNAEEEWARDVSSDIARAVAEVAEVQNRSLAASTVDFVRRNLEQA